MNARDWDRLAAAYASEVCDIFTRDRRNVIGRRLRARGLLRGWADLVVCSNVITFVSATARRAP